MRLDLPQFTPTKDQRLWVGNETKTAQLIQSLWNAAGRRRRDPGFISLLVQCGWTNEREDGRGRESTRIWRNQNIARYLQVEYEPDIQVARELAKGFPKLAQVANLLSRYTGITVYRNPLRPETLRFVEAHSETVAEAFSIVSSRLLAPAAKIKRTVNLITGLGPIRIRGQRISALNGLTPALACLDPSRRFPIMNDKTRRLLQTIGRGRDSEGAFALSTLIGRIPGVRHSFDLDVYAASADFSRVTKPRALKPSVGRFRDFGLKSEIASLAHIVDNRAKIRKLHNELTNRLHDYLLWRYQTPKESWFDAVILFWEKGHHLLIEAKTASEGPGGRAQIRQAIGQLFDYRYQYSSWFPEGQVDLAVLLPS